MPMKKFSTTADRRIVVAAHIQDRQGLISLLVSSVLGAVGKVPGDAAGQATHPPSFEGSKLRSEWKAAASKLGGRIAVGPVLAQIGNHCARNVVTGPLCLLLSVVIPSVCSPGPISIPNRRSEAVGEDMS